MGSVHHLNILFKNIEDYSPRNHQYTLVWGRPWCGQSPVDTLWSGPCLWCVSGGDQWPGASVATDDCRQPRLTSVISPTQSKNTANFSCVPLWLAAFKWQICILSGEDTVWWADLVTVAAKWNVKWNACQTSQDLRHHGQYQLASLWWIGCKVLAAAGNGQCSTFFSCSVSTRAMSWFHALNYPSLWHAETSENRCQRENLLTFRTTRAVKPSDKWFIGSDTDQSFTRKL